MVMCFVISEQHNMFEAYSLQFRDTDVHKVKKVIQGENCFI